jgi:hypothetical protein
MTFFPPSWSKGASQTSALLWRIRAPLFVALTGFFVFSVPPQTREIFRSLALDARSQTEIIVVSSLALLVATLAIWALCFTLANDSADPFARRLASSTSAALLPLGMALGTYWAGMEVKLVGLGQPAGAIEQGVQDAIASLNTLPETLTVVAALCLVLTLVVLLLPPLLFLRNRPTSELADRLSFRTLSLPLYGVGVAVWLGLAFEPLRAPRALGSISVFLFFIILLAVCISELSRFHQRHGIPAISMLLVFALTLSWFNISDNHLITTVKRAEGAREVVPTALAFREWMDARKDASFFTERGLPYPVFIISAEDGGLYAAQFTATFLARAQDRCPNFSQHVFAISAVSGGSIGAGIFASLSKHFATNDQWQDCRFGDLGVGPFEARIRAMLGQDFLSPIVGAALFPDFTHLFVPWLPPARDRARVFDESIEAAWDEVVPGTANPLKESYLAFWEPNGAAPAILANTTQVENGMRVVVTPFMSTDRPPESGSLHYRSPWITSIHNKAGQWEQLDYGWDGLKPSEDITLSTAIGLSARFPWIMPAARFRTSKTEFRLVDGAYIDNSGDETAFDIVMELKQLQAIRGKLTDGSIIPLFEIHLISLADDVALGPGAVQGLGDLLSPVRAMLSTRPTRSQLAKHRVRALVNRAPGITVGTEGAFSSPTPLVELNQTEFTLPLGWQLSETNRTLIAVQSGQAHLCGFTSTFKEAQLNPDTSLEDRQAFDHVNDLVRENNCVACSIPFRLMGQRPTAERACLVR